MTAIKRRRVTPQVRTAAHELADVQRKIARARRIIEQLKEQEAALKELVLPVARSGVDSLVADGMEYTIKYRFVEREGVDLEQVSAFFAKHRKPVPMVDQSYEICRVVIVK